MVIYLKYTTQPHRPVRGSTHSQLAWYCPLWYADSWPYRQQPHPYPQGFSLLLWAVERVRQIGPLCMWSLGPIGNSLTHTLSRNLFPQWAARKNASSKVKGHWPRSDSVITKSMETKSGDHWEITHGMVLKPHKAHNLHYSETNSFYKGNFKKP